MTTTPTFREKLQDLDSWFATAPISETRQMWDVLAALRGPDKDGDVLLKLTGTNWVRKWAFPQLYQRQRDESMYDYVVNAVIYTQDPVWGGVPATTKGIMRTLYTPHFEDHLDRAMRVLGLIEDAKE